LKKINKGEKIKLKTKIINVLRRTWFELLSILSIFFLIYFIPTDYITNSDVINPKLGLLSLFFSKFLFISMGILHATITRKVLFPYINFKEEKGLTSNAIMVIVLYAIIIFGWVRGG